MHAVDGPLVPAFHAALPFPLTGDQPRAIARDRRRPGDAGADAPAAAGRGRLGQDRRRARPRCSWRCRAGTRARSWRRPRCWPSSTSSRCAACSTGSRVRRGGLAARRAAGARRRCSPTARRPPSVGASPTACAAATIDILVGTHALIYGGVEFASLGVAVIDEQHRFGVEQRDLLRGKGDVARRAGDDGHADPAHRGDAHLRRPRPVRAARRCRRGARRSTTEVVGAGPARARRGLRPAARARSPPAARRTSCARSSRAPTSSRRRPRPRSSSGCAHEELAGLRLGLLHGQMPSADKEAAMRAFRARRDRRARRHDRHRGRRRRARTRP